MGLFSRFFLRIPFKLAGDLFLPADVNAADRLDQLTRSLQAYLGHKNIAHTVRYTELAPTRFRHFWKDQSSRSSSFDGTRRFPPPRPVRRRTPLTVVPHPA